MGQHFIDVLDLTTTPLGFFEKEYPNDTREDMRKYLGRFGISGQMQIQKMEELSDGQKSRVVLAKLGREVPHILLLDEPTNHLDMEGIDALAKAVNEYKGGLVLVSHDMRLISQVAKEIWICEHRTIEKYKGDIMNFKMDMRQQMGIENDVKLQGDASVRATSKAKAPKKKKPEPKLEVVLPKPKPAPAKIATISEDTKREDTNKVASTVPSALPTPKEDASKPADAPTVATVGTSGSNSTEGAVPAKKRYIPPHLRKKMAAEA